MFDDPRFSDEQRASFIAAVAAQMNELRSAVYLCKTGKLKGDDLWPVLKRLGVSVAEFASLVGDQISWDEYVREYKTNGSQHAINILIYYGELLDDEGRPFPFRFDQTRPELVDLREQHRSLLAKQRECTETMGRLQSQLGERRQMVEDLVTSIEGLESESFATVEAGKRARAISERDDTLRRLLSDHGRKSREVDLLEDRYDDAEREFNEAMQHRKAIEQQVIELGE